MRKDSIKSNSSGVAPKTDFFPAAVTFTGSLLFALVVYYLICLRIRFPHEMLDKVVSYVLVQMQADSNREAKLLWKSRGDDSFSNNKSVTFTLWGDGKFHSYLIRVGSFPSWVWANKITALRLEVDGASDELRVGDFVLIDNTGEIGLPM